MAAVAAAADDWQTSWLLSWCWEEALVYPLPLPPATDLAL